MTPTRSRQTPSRPRTSTRQVHRLAVVCQRFGADITGGSEFLCRAICHHLAPFYKIDVLTTCARDYVTWANEYEPGKTNHDGITVIRFPTLQTRDMAAFNDFSTWLFSQEHTLRDETRWLEAQGPAVPDLVDYLISHEKEYHAVIFFTYLYYPTYHGLRKVGSKAILVPTAHDEPPIRLGIMREVFKRPRAFIFNSPAEKELVERLFGLRQPWAIAGIGCDPPRRLSRSVYPRKQGFDRPHIVYGGRIDEGKGVHKLIRRYQAYKQSHNRYPYLVLFGRLAMELPPDPDIIYAGFVSEREKWEILAGAAVTVVPSPFESLSIIAIEALAAGTPILVNGSSPVLKDLAIASHGGLYYTNDAEFSAMLELLLTDHRLAAGFAHAGKDYARSHYHWKTVTDKYRTIIDQVIAGRIT